MLNAGFVARSVRRVDYVSKRLTAAISAFGPASGFKLGVQNVRRAQSEVVLKAPGVAPTQRVRLGRGQSDLATFIHVFESRCYSFDAVVDPRWVIDAGANVGYSAVWFASTYPASSVVAIEPDPVNFDLLVKNTTSLSNVIPLQAALSDRPGEALIVDPGIGSWGFQIQRSGERWSDSPTTGSVRCVTIDELIGRFGIEQIDLLKLDIEGGELEVLKHSESWMPRVQAVVAELHDRFRPGCTRAFIEATAGFDLEVVRGENFFVARERPVSS